ncbi:MAG: amino acid permease [Actinomycetaceae bacterium]|nr:amino acid permease [Actinomycetaceae bacterium]
MTEQNIDAHGTPLGDEEGELRRSLSNRHIQLIAIGGAIGTGLFMGAGKSISVAGPSILLVYATIGVMLFFVMRAMGELLLHNLNYKSFQDFAADLLGPWAGFFVGWTYWFSWVVIGVADIIAITGYWQFWLGEDRQGLAAAFAIIVMFVLLLMNLATVRLFGEIEFWFAIIKLVAIVALVVVGIVMIFSGFTSPNGTEATVTHLWEHGVMPNGWMGFVGGFQLAVFAFVGIELVGTTAAETANPRVTLPRAINAIPIRVLLFYVVALATIMSITPWDQINPETSPFVRLFSLAGFVSAAWVMNAVVMSSAASSCNSGIYSTSRMLFGLAYKGMAPRIFAKLSRGGVPWVGLILPVAIICISRMLMLSEGVVQAFTMVTTVASVLFIFVWTIILVSYIVYRRRYPEANRTSEYRMPGGSFMPWVVLAFFVFVIYALLTESDTRTALAVTPIWFILVGAAWYFVRNRVGGRGDGSVGATGPLPSSGGTGATRPFSNEAASSHERDRERFGPHGERSGSALKDERPGSAWND